MKSSIREEKYKSLKELTGGKTPTKQFNGINSPLVRSYSDKKLKLLKYG